MRTTLDLRLVDPSGDEPGLVVDLRDERRERRCPGDRRNFSALPRRRDASTRDELLAAWHPQGARGRAEG
jgi:hypothetical protein